MEYVRESWNILRTPENLIESIESRNDEAFNREVIISLLKLNSNLSSPPLLLNYLEKLFLHYPTIFIEILSSDACTEYGLSFIRLINQVGSQFIDFLNADNDISTAKCVRNLLKFLLLSEPEDICIKAIMNLSLKLKFSALIASSRVYFEADIINLQSSIQEKIFSQDFLTPTFTMSQLKRSFFYNKIDEGIPYHRHRLLPLLIWNFINTGKLTFLTKFLSKRALLIIFRYFISEYINSPSLFIAYLIICIFPKVINEDLQQIISDIKEIENENEYEDDDAQEIDFMLKSNIIERILTNESFIEPRPKDLIDNVFMYPKSITTFSERLLKLTKVEKISALYEISPCLVKNSSDVILLLILQNKLSEFLLKLSIVCEKSPKDNNFHTIWFLFLHYAKRCWSFGSELVRNMVRSMMEKTSIEMKYFLTALFTYKKPDFKISSANHESYFLRSVAILEKLMDNNPLETFTKIVEKSEPLPHFWPSILLSCICTPKIEYVEVISKMKFPDSEITNVLFNHFMVIINSVGEKMNPNNPNKHSILSILNIPDYDMLIQYSSIEKSTLKEILKNDIFALMKSPPPLMDEFNRMACIWRSYSKILGVKNFAEVIIDVLNILTTKRNVPCDSSLISEKVAFMFGSIFEFNRDELFSDILDKFFEKFDDEFFCNRDLAIGLGSFCITLILIVDQNDGFDKLFDKTFDFARSCVESFTVKPTIQSTERMKFNTKIAFAQSFIRKALFIPIMQNKIIEAPFDYLVKIQDWKTLTDFFIVKSKIKQQNE